MKQARIKTKRSTRFNKLVKDNENSWYLAAKHTIALYKSPTLFTRFKNWLLMCKTSNKPTGLNSGAVLREWTSVGSSAGRFEVVQALLNVAVVDKHGNPILKKDGTPKTKALITKAQAQKLLGIKK